MIYVYVCILGGFDNLRPPLVPSEPGTRFICFTDVPVLPNVAPWEFRPIHRIEKDDLQGFGHGTLDASRTSRLPKILPHLMLPEDCDYSIWLDGNFQLRKPASEIVNTELRFDDWAAHRHPARDCVYKEAELLAKASRERPAEWPGLSPDAVEAEAQSYRDAEYPAINGLTANGIMIRRHAEIVKRTCEAWWSLYSAGCGRDQLSFPVAAWQTGLKYNSIPHYPDIYASPLAKFGWHAAWKDKEPTVQYREERQRIARRVDKLREIVGDGGYDWRLR